MGQLFAQPEALPHELLVRIQAQAGDLRDKKNRQRRWQRSSTYTKREDKVRDLLETLTRLPWPSCRPVWLVNPETGKRMELDCYCVSLPGSAGGGCAVEVGGIQHYRFTPFYHTEEGSFQAQRTRDLVKDRLCKAMGVTLIRIPPRSRLCDSQLASYLTYQLASHNVYTR